MLRVSVAKMGRDRLLKLLPMTLIPVTHFTTAPMATRTPGRVTGRDLGSVLSLQVVGGERPGEG